eukprot:108601-Rhodomonas_salina.1
MHKQEVPLGVLTDKRASLLGRCPRARRQTSWSASSTRAGSCASPEIALAVPRRWSSCPWLLKGLHACIPPSRLSLHCYRES